MKKTLTLLLAILTALTLSACAVHAPAHVMQPIAESNAAAAPEEKAPAAPAPAADPVPAKELTAEQAQAIALSHAGLAETDVTFMYTHCDWEDGYAEYEIEFFSGDREYDYEIDVLTGAIRSFDSEPEHKAAPSKDEPHEKAPATAQPADTVTLLTKEDVKSIALTHAGVAEADVRFEKAELDRDDGHAEYEIEFHVGSTEYEYEIHAETGEIRKAEKDFDH